MRMKLVLGLLVVALGVTSLPQPAAALEVEVEIPGVLEIGLDGNLPPLYPLDTLPPTSLDNAVLQWNEEALECIRDTKPGPTVVARSLAVVHTAMYDAWAAYDGRAVGTRLGASFRRSALERLGPIGYLNKSRAISIAAFEALRDQYPTCTQSFLERLLALGYTHLDITPPAMVGRRAAEAVLSFRHGDGSNQLNGYADTTGYASVNTADQINDPWRWQPLRVAGNVQRASTPHWRLVTPFALSSASQFRPPPPSTDPATTTQDMLAMSAALDDRHKIQAEYWADGPSSEFPPGHWNLFAQWVSRRRNHTLDQDIRLFFALNNAMLDAGIVAWEAKYAYDFSRPITGIRGSLAGQMVQAWGGPYQGTQTIPAEEWQPYQAPNVVTPPFPEYVSGHSTFSGAGANILRTFTGSDTFGASVTIRPGTSFVEPRTSTHPGVPAANVRLSWPTFTAAADEAGISRRYGGIHWLEGDMAGRGMGNQVGSLAWARAQRYWNGQG
jgi:hypothetical protein